MRREIEYVMLEYRPSRDGFSGRVREFHLELKLAGCDVAHYTHQVELDEIRSVYDILMEHLTSDMKHFLLSTTR